MGKKDKYILGLCFYLHFLVSLYYSYLLLDVKFLLVQNYVTKVRIQIIQLMHQHFS